MTEPAPPPPVEEDGPTSTPRVLGMLGLPDASADQVAPVVAAVNALVAAPAGWLTPDAAGVWAPHHVHGATMLAARLFRRRHSPAGVETFGAEGAVYVQRNDPDVAMLLGLGAYARPVVG